MSVERNLTEPADSASGATFLGHPRGLYVLFFVEMWERFSYYGMRALLIFYMTKGFLGYGDGPAYGVYGAYTALVYATPFIGGMLADRLLGPARAVILGGMLMAAGHLLMTFENPLAFYTALALLICGNGFFKPNISTMVGSMYAADSPKRDAGFTIFYMGINLGAAMSPLLCGYVGETFGWHYGFGLATIGMLTGLLTFVANRMIARILIGLTAVTTFSCMVWFHWGDPIQFGSNTPVGIALVVAAFIAIAALASGGLPPHLGEPKDPNRMSETALPQLRLQPVPFYLAIIAAILLLQHVIHPFTDFAVMLMIVGGYVIVLPWLKASTAVYLGTAASVPVIGILVQNNALAGILLAIFGGGALFRLAADAYRAEKIERERMYVVLVLMFFSMLFWAFFEQAGSSLNNFTDRNVNRMVGGRVLSESDIGTELKDVEITSAFLGRLVAGRAWDLKLVDAAQSAARKALREHPGEKASVEELQQAMDDAALKEVDRVIQTRRNAENEQDENPALNEKPEVTSSPPKLGWRTKLSRALLTNRLRPRIPSVNVTREMVGMNAEGREIKASIFQAANPIFILICGLPMSMLWVSLGVRGWEPNTAVKFSLGLFQLGLGFGAIWLGARYASSHGLVAVGWLLLGYFFHTTGELCLSPVGLSMVTKLSPVRMVSTVMGAWFLASAFSNYMAGMIAKMTGVGEESGKAESIIPPPVDTVKVYGEVFGYIAIAAVVSSFVLLVLSPLLHRWMHGAGEPNGKGGH